MVEDVPSLATTTPIPPRERIASIDVLRGVAVLGILLMNIVAMGLPFAAYDDPTIAGNRSAVDFLCWAVNDVLTDGKMRAIFSMLFGASMILFVSRAATRTTGDAALDLHLRRNLWLVLFGAVHSYLLLWVGDVLFTYGVAGLPLVAFRRLRPRTLLGLGAILLVLQAPKTAVHNMELAEASQGLREQDRLIAAGGLMTLEQAKSRERWLESLSQEKPSPEELQRALERRHNSYWGDVAGAAQSTIYVESTYLYKVGLWDAAALMLIGMGLLELGVFSATRSYRFYCAMALAGYGIGLPVGVWIVANWMGHDFAAGMRWSSLFDVTRVSVALGHVAVVMMVCKAGVAVWATAPLAAVGRMALTNYIMQTVICMTLFRGFGLGWFGQLARHQLYYVVGAIWLFQLIASPLWLRWYRFGPLEWLWRSLTYKRAQPFRVAAPSILRV